MPDDETIVESPFRFRESTDEARGREDIESIEDRSSARLNLALQSLLARISALEDRPAQRIEVVRPPFDIVGDPIQDADAFLQWLVEQPFGSHSYMDSFGREVSLGPSRYPDATR